MRSRLALAAVFAAAADFDHRTQFRKSGMLRRRTDSFGELVVVDMCRLPARITDQENAVVETARMLVCDIGIGAFDPARQVRADEKVENSVHAVCRYPLASRLGYGFGNVVCARRLVETCQRIEHRRAHVGPLLSALDHPPCGGVAQRIAVVELV